MPRGAIEWRNEGEVSSVDVRCGGLSGRTNPGSIATGPPMQMPVPSISKSHIQGLNLPDLTDSVEFLRGGFWRRAVALFIDLVAVVAVLQVTALALFPLSNGHVQFSAGLLYDLNCEYLESVPKGLSISIEFDANSITDCQQSLLGLPTSRALSVSRITRDSAVTKVAQIRHMLDAEGRPASGLPLDILILPLLIALRFALDRIGGSIGRRICCIRLSNGLNGQYPPAAASMNRRYAALALPLAPVWIWSSCAALFPGPELGDPRLYWLCWVGTGIPLLIAALEAADSIIRRRDTFYDRIAGTSVLRLDEKKAVIAMAGVAAPPSLGQSDSSRPHLMPEPSYVPPPLLPQQASRSRNYIARHWRGELSLPVSYWLNGILGAVVVGATVGVLAYAINQQSDAQPVLWLFSLIATWTSAALLTIWQAVGVWRSATRYRQRGKRFWGAAAKALVLLGVAQLAANFVMVGTAQMAGIYEIVSGDARVGPHEFHILANGETLEFSGGITFGVTQELERFLNAMAGVRSVRLNSTGGRILEAQKMSDMIRSRDLATVVAVDCLSACTIVFLGGKERLMLPGARLGFHQPAFRGMTAADRSAAIATEQLRLQGFGLSSAFAARATSALPSGMWYPDKDELVRERVATRVISPTQESPVDRSFVETSSPDAGGTDMPIARVTVPTAARSAPAAGLSATGDSTASTGAAAYGPVRNRVPADLLKRLSSVPRKTTVIPQLAPTPK